MKRSDPVQLRLVAVVEEAQVITQRIRDLQSQAKEAIGPKNAPQGIPMDSSALFAGRILSIREFVNPFTGIPLWRVELDISGFNLDVLVRKDKCTGTPQPGFYLSGIVWLIGDLLPSEASAAAEYIG